jgi:hypothetical protein
MYENHHLLVKTVICENKNCLCANSVLSRINSTLANQVNLLNVYIKVNEGWVAQWLYCLPTIYEALGLFPSIEKRSIVFN